MNSAAPSSYNRTTILRHQTVEARRPNGGRPGSSEVARMLAAAPVPALSDRGQNRAHRHGTLFALHTHGHLHELLVVTGDAVLRIGRGLC